MCGIAGIAGMNDTVLAGRKVLAMTEALSYRGPDGRGLNVEDGIAFGHARLAIIDLSEAADQPMTDRSGRYTIVLNGEIYNYRELRAAFPDFSYKTDSDTEAILAAYDALGPKCLDRFHGMFAFAIWDRRERSLFLARDRCGVKPLYYFIDSDGAVLFSSAIRSLLASDSVERKIDRKALRDYVMFQSVYSPATIVEGVRQLRAGHFAVMRDGEFTETRYWDLTEYGGPVTEDHEQIKTGVRERLLRSVERRMVSDVPVGAFLSGGIDSSAVVALMSRVSDQPVRTFSVTFAESSFDESKYSSLIARRFSTDHTPIELSAGHLLDELPSFLASVDSPSGDGLNTYVVSKATREAGVKVALSGIGGDELFAGYSYFHRWLKFSRSGVEKVPFAFRNAFSRVAEFVGNSKYQRLGSIIGAKELDISSFYPFARQLMSTSAVDRLLPEAEDRAIPIRNLLASQSDELRDFPLLSQFSIAELLGYTQNVLLKDIDQFSMASALEVREPFFDHELIEYVLRVPDRSKANGKPKSLLVDALDGLLPAEIVDRPKMGFVVPMEQWMRNELKEFCEGCLNRLADRGLFDGEALLKRWDMFLSGRALWSEVWHLVVLTHWLEQNDL